ncbi:MAG: GGDEF domain-containing protein [Oscillospiraceae bacterium]|nr:GGDEF domain-containing protein [Oscillospiraceae bacterium]
MTELLKIISGVISDYRLHLTGSKIKEFESEDPLSKKLLEQNLCLVNGKRAIFLSLPLVLLSVIFAVITVVQMDPDSLIGSVLSLIGFLLIALGCSALAVLIYHLCKYNKSNTIKLQQFTLLFWTVFSAGSLLLIAADLSLNGFSQRFYLYLIIMTVFPLIDIKKSLLIIVPFLAVTELLGIIFGASVLVLVLALAFSLAYLMISSLVYSSYCCLYIGERMLNTANERCRQINEIDGLTGALNKKGLIKRLMDIINLGVNKNIAAIFFDIDDFRRYNHIYTDKESDDCLHNICNCVRIIAKSKTDIISRYGGDEFVIIIQNITEYDLIFFAEQIRKSVETMALPFENDKKVTISVGVSAIVEEDLKDYSSLLRDAENGLVLAKSGGKNCVGYMGNVFKAK